MRKSLTFTIFSILCFTHQYALSAPTITSKSPLSDQAGYSLGYLLGKNNTEALQGINLDAFIQGLMVASTNQDPSLSEDQMGQVLNTYKKKTEAKEFLELKQQADNNLVSGNAFLAQNAKKQGVVTTPTGLQYLTIQEGSGNTPKATSTVQINYEGRLINGTVFDSSIARQQPVTLKISDVVTGLAQGLLTMKEGGKSRFFIPAKLGYGTIGSGDAIQPNSALIFDVELLKVEN